MGLTYRPRLVQILRASPNDDRSASQIAKPERWLLDFLSITPALRKLALYFWGCFERVGDITAQASRPLSDMHLPRLISLELGNVPVPPKRSMHSSRGTLRLWNTSISLISVLCKSVQRTSCRCGLVCWTCSRTGG